MRTTTIHPLAILLWNLRCILARWAADIAPVDTDDGPTLASHATAYDAMGPDGFRLYGAFGQDRDSDSTDPLTEATGFDGSGEVIGVRCEERKVADTGDGRDFDIRNWHAHQSSAEGLASTLDMLDGQLIKAPLEVLDGIRADYQEEMDPLLAERREAEVFGNSEQILSLEGKLDSVRAQRKEDLDSALELGRWAHIRDAHVAETEAWEAAVSRPVPEPGPLPGEMERAKEEREALVASVARELEVRRRLYRLAMAKGNAVKAQRIVAKAQEYKAALRRDYGRMAALLGPGQSPTRWRFLPFTRKQGEELGILTPKQ